MPVQELFATPSQSEKKREEAFIVKAVIRYFEKPVTGVCRPAVRWSLRSSRHFIVILTPRIESLLVREAQARKKKAGYLTLPFLRFRNHSSMRVLRISRTPAWE